MHREDIITRKETYYGVVTMNGKYGGNVIECCDGDTEYTLTTRKYVKGFDIPVKVIHKISNDKWFAELDGCALEIIDVMKQPKKNMESTFLPDLNIPGVWGGSIVECSHYNTKYKFTTKIGVRGFNIPVVVMRIEDKWSVWHNGDSLEILKVEQFKIEPTQQKESTMAFEKIKSTTEYKLSLEDMSKLIAKELSVKPENVSVRYIIEEVETDPMDRFPGRNEVTKIHVTVNQ